VKENHAGQKEFVLFFRMQYRLYSFDLFLVKPGATEKVSLRQRIIGTKSKQ
jgi:hypothetical protein